MKKVLITGGTGFFGKSILDYFSRHACEYDLTILSRHGLSPDFLSTLTSQTDPSSLRLRPSSSPILAPKQILGDVRTFELPQDTHFDYIVHAATPARVDIPDDEMRSIIIDGTDNALKQAKKCCATKFMMVSSGGVYGKGFARPISEDDEPHPHTAYGKAKLEAEQMAIDSGLYTLIPRCFAFVGRHLDRNAHFAIGNFIRDAQAGKDIVINGDGSPMRSYMYADDLVEWLFAILERGDTGRPYNVGSDEAISISNLAAIVRDAFGSRSVVKVLGKSVSGAANYYVPYIELAKNDLGLNVKTDLIKAIKRSAL